MTNLALQPIPLDFLRLSPSLGPPDHRKEEITAETSFSDRVFRPTRPMYPFTVFHAGSLRRYILYASSEAERNKWKKVLEETKSLRDVYMDGNKVRRCSMLSCGMNDVLLRHFWQLFAFNTIQDGRFRSRTIHVPSSTAKDDFTGRIISIAAFSRKYSSSPNLFCLPILSLCQGVKNATSLPSPLKTVSTSACATVSTGLIEY